MNRQQTISQYMRESGETVSPLSIADMYGVSQRYAALLLHRIAKRGWALRTGYGTYVHATHDPDSLPAPPTGPQDIPAPAFLRRT